MKSLIIFFCSFLYQTIVSMLPCLCSWNGSKNTSKCGKSISKTFSCASCATFLFLQNFHKSLIYNWTDARQQAIYFLKHVVKELIRNFHHTIKYECISPTVTTKTLIINYDFFSFKSQTPPVFLTDLHCDWPSFNNTYSKSILIIYL